MDPTSTLAGLEYPGRLIVIGAPEGGAGAAIVYAITGRSPSSQARRLVHRDGDARSAPDRDGVKIHRSERRRSPRSPRRPPE